MTEPRQARYVVTQQRGERLLYLAPTDNAAIYVAEFAKARTFVHRDVAEAAARLCGGDVTRIDELVI